MMRLQWVAVALTLVALLAAGCGGGASEDFLEPIVGTPDPNRTPGPQGDASVIEFVVPDTQAEGQVGFEPLIGPVGSSDPQASRVQFRVLNAQGRGARNGIRVLFSLEGPPDVSLTDLEARTRDGLVETIVRAGSTRGTATVVAQVEGTNLVARSTAIVIGQPRTEAVAIEFFGLRIPDLFAEEGEEEEPDPGTPQSRTQLGLRGSGLNQAVDVIFALLGASGGAAVDGTIVDFTLFGPNGGEFASPPMATSGDGFVFTTVFTGDRPGPVQVEARVRGTDLTARAIPLTIGGTLNPSASNLSIAFECLNVAGRVFFGIRDRIRVGLSDQFQNPVPLGSGVSFFTEGGAIQTQGITDDDLFEAEADLVTQSPVPADGRVTVMVVTTGQESFTDTNANGRFDLGEPFVDLPPEPFLDANENGVFDLGEFFLDNNDNGTFDPVSNGLWDDQILIARSGVVIFSGPTRIDIEPTTFSILLGSSQVFTLTVADDIGNPLVGGTKIKLTASAGTVFPSEITITDTNTDASGGPIPGITLFTVVLTNDGEPGENTFFQAGTLTVEVESGAGGQQGKCPGTNGDASLTILGQVEVASPGNEEAGENGN